MIETRQLMYFVRAVELGSLSRAATDLRTVASALSQQISKLESDVRTRLLNRTPRGVVPTAAGVEFYREAQLALRHIQQAGVAAQNTRSAGRVSVGLAPSTSAVLGLALLRAMKEHYPDVNLHMVEAPSGVLSDMLNSRKIDLAVLFDIDAAWRWNVLPLVEERIYLVQNTRDKAAGGRRKVVAIEKLKDIPLIIASPAAVTRAALNMYFARAGIKPKITAEVDCLSTQMEAVNAGLGATLVSGSALARWPDAFRRFHVSELEDVVRVNSLCSMLNDEMPMPILGARNVIANCSMQLANDGTWIGATVSRGSR